MIAPSLPIYMHADAIRIERALEATGDGVETLARDYTPLEEGQPVRVGAIEVLPIVTSRRSYRNFAFLITTPDGTLHWTGDLALHGPDAHLTFDQMEFLKARQIDVLLCDTTAFMDDILLHSNGTTDPHAIVPSRTIPAGMLDAAEVERELLARLKAQPGLTVFNFYPRETDEARRYMAWAAEAGRVCVFEPDCAYLLLKFFGGRPTVFIPDVARYSDDPAAQPAWFRELLENCRVVTRAELARHPAGYLLQNSYRHLLELFDLPDEGGAYWHVGGQPLGAYDPAFQNLQRVLARTQFAYVSFGHQRYFRHGYPQQVKYFCDQVDPKVLIPCHGFKPERLLPNSGQQLRPALGQAYILANGHLRPERESAG